MAGPIVPWEVLSGVVSLHLVFAPLFSLFFFSWPATELFSVKRDQVSALFFFFVVCIWSVPSLCSFCLLSFYCGNIDATVCAQGSLEQGLGFRVVYLE